MLCDPLFEGPGANVVTNGGGDNGEEPTPPGFDPETWTQMPGTQERAGSHWWDPNMGEWRWHPPDQWHETGHWDYNPWTEWNSPWQNVYPQNHGTP